MPIMVSEALCGPVCVCFITGLGRRAESGEIPPIRDWCESAFGDHGKSTQLKSVIHGRCYLREEFEFPRVTPLLDFIHFTMLLVMFLCNKIVQLHWMKTFIWIYHFVCVK